jgi:hypothetical protein
MAILPDEHDTAIREHGNRMDEVARLHDVVGRDDKTVFALAGVGSQTNPFVVDQWF